MSETEPILQGKLILDSGKLQGSFFDRTVILICRHDESGAFGLVLNRPTKHTLGAAAREPLSPRLAQTPLHVGGPVQPEVLSFLVETESRPDFDILPSVILGHSLEDLKQQFDSAKEPLRVRAFAGYAGWSPGQLEQEQKNGCWVNHPGSVELVFHPKSQNLWQHVLKIKGGVYRLVADFPENPAAN